jgi:hypothetical protein
VEPGTPYSVTGTLGRGLAAGSRGDTYIPSLYVGARHGGIAGDGRSAWLAGAQASPFLLLLLLDANDDDDFADIVLATSYVDLYVQPGTRGERWDGGAGALASSEVIAPYVQLGRRGDGGRGWHTTQMIALLNDPFPDASFWMPALVWRDPGKPGGTSAVSVGLTGAIPIGAHREDWFFAVTFTAEVGLERSGAR